jgi:hypothetical protein
MEPMMINAKILTAAAALALMLPILLPSTAFAQNGARPGAGRAGGVRPGGGAAFRPGGGAPAARFSGAPGGGYRGGYGGGGYRGGYGGGVVPGVVAGAVIGGAIAAAPYGYYGSPGYYAPGYYDGDQYVDDGNVAVAPGPGPGGGDDAVAYCMQTYRSYDPRSGTYMGNDGYRHPCP